MSFPEQAGTGLAAGTDASNTLVSLRNENATLRAELFSESEAYQNMRQMRDALNTQLVALKQSVLDEGPEISERIFKRAPC